jgi:MerR, DNA binding
VLEIADSGEPACEHVRALIGERIATVDRQLAQLRKARRLSDLATRAAAQDPADCAGYRTILATSGESPPEDA